MADKEDGILHRKNTTLEGRKHTKKLVSDMVSYLLTAHLQHFGTRQIGLGKNPKAVQTQAALFTLSNTVFLFVKCVQLNLSEYRHTSEILYV